MNLGSFGNEYVVNLQWLVGLTVFIVMAAPIFGYFYNKLMDRLTWHEHTSLYVAIGNFITICFGALISWKAAIFFLILFALTGTPMIHGEFKRTAKKIKTPMKLSKVQNENTNVLLKLSEARNIQVEK